MKMGRSGRRLRTAAAILLVVLLGALPAIGETLREEFSQTFSLSPGGAVSLRNTNGDLDFTSWARNEVRIEATKIVKAMGRGRAEDLMEKLEIEIVHDGDSLVVKTVFPQRNSALGWLFGRGVDAKVSYRVTLPLEVELDAHTVNGDVDVASVTGAIDARTTNGQIHIRELAGTARARTTNGSIRAELQKVNGASDCEFRTTNGGITLFVPETLGAEVVATTTTGAVNTDFAVLERSGSSRWRRKSLKGEINGGGSKLTLVTTNGSIQLRRLGAGDASESN
ncbi:MAG: DUF4097 family beta strand repeat-containing protein [Acidobacteriota bacterium]|nr:DUF4097 family beta strand repeat-containing protein [Acidobacteriota bacterium]